MHGSFVVAANSGSASASALKPVQIIKIVKPAAGQTEIFHASFEGSVKIDFTAIANEKVTLFHDSKNQSLHVIFTDGSQAIIEPFFDYDGRDVELQFLRWRRARSWIARSFRRSFRSRGTRAYCRL